MPTPITRESLSKDLATRYATQREGGAFDIKKTLGGPGTSPQTGTTIDATSMNGGKFQSPNGFEVRIPQQVTQMLDAQGNTSRQLSTYAKGLNNKKYKP